MLTGAFPSPSHSVAAGQASLAFLPVNVTLRTDIEFPGSVNGNVHQGAHLAITRRPMK